MLIDVRFIDILSTFVYSSPHHGERSQGSAEMGSALPSNGECDVGLSQVWCVATDAEEVGCEISEGRDRGVSVQEQKTGELTEAKGIRARRSVDSRAAKTEFGSPTDSE